jgi:hypothetical protein
VSPMLRPFALWADPATRLRPVPAPGTAALDALRARKRAHPWMFVNGTPWRTAWDSRSGRDVADLPGQMTVGSYN